jgi:murein DD-endopeptidase MepM/ murein hydrolase activator NlpD
MALGDRLKTIAFTAILTSIAWIAFGGVLGNLGGLFTVREVKTATPTKPIATSAPAQIPTAAAPRAPAAPSVPSGYLLPVANVRPGQLIDTFTQARSGGRVHDAIDIMAPRGTPVFAAVPGMVEKLFTSKLGGLTIYVRSPDRRTITYYAHLDGYAPGLAEGQQVRQGQVIGSVGFTGNASPTAPHLHFAIMQTEPDNQWWEPSVAINPYPLLVSR